MVLQASIILNLKLPNLREVSKLSTTGRNFLGLFQYTSVDDHNVGEFCCKAELDLHSTVELKTKALWEHWEDTHSNEDFCITLNNLKANTSKRSTVGDSPLQVSGRGRCRTVLGGPYGVSKRTSLRQIASQLQSLPSSSDLEATHVWKE